VAERRRAVLTDEIHQPWVGQLLLSALVLDRRARFTVVVAARQIGKTRGAAKVVIDALMRAAPGAMAGVVTPTYVHAEAAAAALRRLAEPLGGVWREQKHTLELPGGRFVRLFSTDRKETVRGPTLCILWIEEAALLHVRARDAALGALAAVQGAQVLVTSSPVGKNWLAEWWDRAGTAPGWARLRFRTEDSPYHDPAYLAEMRATLPAEVYAQEFDAVFVDTIDLVFRDRSRLFVDAFPERRDPARTWLGVDLGRSQDYTVVCAMNEWQEAELVWRGRQDDLVRAADEDRFWPALTDLLAGIADAYRAGGVAIVIDTGGPGGGPGAVLAGYLRARGLEVVEVSTSNVGTKAAVVEQAGADVEFARVQVLRGPLADVLEEEMSRFLRVKRVVRGRELNLYEGPQIRGVHDDAVIAFCLANWGRVQDLRPDPLARLDLDGEWVGPDVGGRPAKGEGWGAVPGSGYAL
jgi:hypothetical protein